MTELCIQRLNAGGVITNYHCVSRCGHCLYNCSPRRARDYLDRSRAEVIFRRIAGLGCRSVHIGGGEPMLDPEKLMGVLTAARNAGVGIDYVETNSAWYVNPDQAMATLKALQKAGVQMLLVSISPFHNAHIPFARVKGVMDACRRIGMNIFPWVNDFVRDLGRLDENRTHSMDDFKNAFGADYLRRIPDRYWIHLGGRALSTFRNAYPRHPVRHILDSSPASCAKALGDTSHFHIDLYGNYIPGLCSGLAILMDDLGSPLSADNYPLIHRLATTGVRGLHAMAIQSWGYQPSRKTFLNHCDLCSDIRHFIMKQDLAGFPELSPAEFYAETETME